MRLHPETTVTPEFTQAEAAVIIRALISFKRNSSTGPAIIEATSALEKIRYDLSVAEGVDAAEAIGEGEY